MKTKKNSILIIMFLTAFTFSQPLAAWSSEYLDHMDKLMLLRHFSEQNLFDGRIILRFDEKLNLSAAQLEKIESLLMGFEEISISRNAGIKIMELRLAAQLKEQKTNRKAVEKLLRDIDKEKTDLFIAYLNYLFDLKEVLTPNQIGQLREMKAKFKDYFHKRRESRPSGEEGNPPSARDKDEGDADDIEAAFVM